MQIYTVHIHTCAHVCSVNVHGISFHSLAHLYVCVQNVHVCVAASVAQLVRASSPRKRWWWV